VEKGECKVEKGGKVVHVVKPGDYFGECELLEEKPNA
jgi:CRP-like cAMP-binding protein